MAGNKRLERMNRLISIIKERNGASVRELAGLLQVSEMTIRRDLQVLTSNHIVNNVYGAAIYNPASSGSNLMADSSETGYTLVDAKVTQNDEKNRIGKYAASLIEENDVVIIDTGSTTEKLALHISEDIASTILCYNLNILNTLSDRPNVHLIFAGGYYHPNTQMFESAESLSLIGRVRASKAFVSAAGIHEKLGLTCANNYEAPTKSAIMDSAVEKILLADSSKFGKVKSSYFAELSDFHTVITDTGLSAEWGRIIKAHGIRLVMV